MRWARRSNRYQKAFAKSTSESCLVLGIGATSWGKRASKVFGTDPATAFQAARRSSIDPPVQIEFEGSF